MKTFLALLLTLAVAAVPARADELADVDAKIAALAPPPAAPAPERLSRLAAPAPVELEVAQPSMTAVVVATPEEPSQAAHAAKWFAIGAVVVVVIEAAAVVFATDTSLDGLRMGPG